jgi:hypothetical protein
MPTRKRSLATRKRSTQKHAATSFNSDYKILKTFKPHESIKIKVFNENKKYLKTVTYFFDSVYMKGSKLKKNKRVVLNLFPKNDDGAFNSFYKSVGDDYYLSDANAKYFYKFA